MSSITSQSVWMQAMHQSSLEFVTFYQALYATALGGPTSRGGSRGDLGADSKFAERSSSYAPGGGLQWAEGGTAVDAFMAFTRSVEALARISYADASDSAVEVWRPTISDVLQTSALIRAEGSELLRELLIEYARHQTWDHRRLVVTDYATHLCAFLVHEITSRQRARDRRHAYGATPMERVLRQANEMAAQQRSAPPVSSGGGCGCLVLLGGLSASLLGFVLLLALR